jgi:hypothetical protein
MERFNKAGFSKKNPLKLIEGYQDEPIASLEEALEPFIDIIDQLSDQIKEAKTNCHYPPDHDLTRDESAAIYLYSMRNTNSVYVHLEDAWASWDRSQMKPWFKYLNLLKSALDKLPNIETEIWQGIPFNEDLENTLRTDPLELYTCMGSCLQSKKEIKHHLNNMPISEVIFVRYGLVDGKDVTAYTKDSIKGISMMWPGMKLNKAKNVKIDSHGSFNLYLVKMLGKSSTCPSHKFSLFLYPIQNKTEGLKFAWILLK